MSLLILGLVIFIGIHFVTSMPAIRAGITAKISENGYRVLHSIAALSGLVLIIYGFGQARQEDLYPLYVPPFWLRHLALLLLLPIFVFVFAALFKGHITKFTKHPIVLAIKIWAFSHLLVNGEPYSVALFGSFLVWAIWARISLAKRDRLNPPDRNYTNMWRNDLIAVVLGLGLYVLFVLKLHKWLIGIAVV